LSVDLAVARHLPRRQVSGGGPPPHFNKTGDNLMAGRDRTLLASPCRDHRISRSHTLTGPSSDSNRPVLFDSSFELGPGPRCVCPLRSSTASTALTAAYNIQRSRHDENVRRRGVAGRACRQRRACQQSVGRLAYQLGGGNEATASQQPDSTPVGTRPHWAAGMAPEWGRWSQSGW
jgi:hypothetical protein